MTSTIKFLVRKTISSNLCRSLHTPTIKTTHFGFETVDENEKSEKVHQVFRNVANKYDIMNDAMSFGIHRVWKDLFIRRLAPLPGTRLLDVAGGTGDIAFRYINSLNNSSANIKINPLKSHVTIFDINQSMLDVGKKRAEEKGLISNQAMEINWICGDAEDLKLPDESYSAYTIAFGIRNCTHIDKVLKEAYRVLQPGGRFMCLEFSKLEFDQLQKIYDQYSFNIIPAMGQIIAGQWKPYQYLVESIRQFPDQEAFKGMIEDAEFRNVTYENLTLGVVSIHSGYKI